MDSGRPTFSIDIKPIPWSESSKVVSEMVGVYRNASISDLENDEYYKDFLNVHKNVIRVQFREILKQTEMILFEHPEIEC